MRSMLHLSIFLVGLISLNACKQDPQPIDDTSQTVAPPVKTESSKSNYPTINQSSNKTTTSVILKQNKLNSAKNIAAKRRQIDSIRMKKNNN